LISRRDQEGVSWRERIFVLPREERIFVLPREERILM